MIFKIKILSMLILIFFYQGCDVDPSEYKDKSNINNRSTSIILNINATAIKESSSEEELLSKISSDLYEGELLIKNLTKNTNQIIPWHATLNNETFKFTSDKKISLESGTYKLTFLLKNGNSKKYIGTNTVVVTNNQVLDLNFNLSPVIGDLDIELNDINNMNNFTFKYEKEDLSSLTNPIIHFILDDNEDKAINLNINPNNSSVNIVAHIENGEHKIKLKLFDGDKQIGESSKDINISKEVDILIDIKPLKVDFTFDFNSTLGKNRLNLKINDELFKLTQNINNTKSIIKLKDKNSNIFETKEFQIIENSGIYTANIELNNLKIDTNISIDIEFFNISENLLVGGIKIENIELNKNNKTFSAKLSLYYKSNLTTSILASLTLNVTKEFVALEGASIFIDDKFVGLTENNNIGNSGSFQIFIKKGNHTILVKENNITVASKNITAKPLEILNIDINIDNNNQNEVNHNPNAFKILIKTDIVDVNDINFTIGINSEYTYNYSVDCNNDGVLEAENISTKYICTYQSSGEYLVAISGDFPHFYSGNGYTERKNINKKIIKIKQWGDISWKNMKNSFENSSIEEIETLQSPNLSNVTNMSSVFYFSEKFNSNISGWNVSNITNMSRAFYKARKFNQDLSNWNVSSLIEMENMFKEANSFSNQNLSSWNVSNVTNHKDFNLNWGQNNISPTF